MNELSGIPTAVLEAEIKKRADDEAAGRHALALERSAAISRALKEPGVVDALAGEHDRTSCSDENPSNGYGTEYRLPRCRRCQLLGAARTGWPTYLTLNVQIEHWR